MRHAVFPHPSQATTSVIAPLRVPSERQLGLRVILFVALMFVFNILLDLGLKSFGERTTEIFVISDLIVSLFAGGLFLELLRERRKRIIRRLATISEMNHHIRNALEVITLSSYNKSEKEVEQIGAAIERIDWALKEILPKV